MKDKDFELLEERKALLTDDGYFARYRVLCQHCRSREAWTTVETELLEAFNVRRFLTYAACHQAMLRHSGAVRRKKRRPFIRLYSEVNTV